MKQCLLIFVFTMGLAFNTIAQIHPRTLGVRLGGGTLGSAELSYQQAFSDINRLELDLGWGGSIFINQMNIIGIYHWLWNIDGGLNWYIGPGVALGLHSYKDDPGYLNVSLGGQIGIEYDFSVKNRPILLSIDARPMWDFLGKNERLGWGSSIGIRYILKGNSE
jgi:hypothetical protein